VTVDLLRDIDAAVAHRDAAQLRNFAYEAAASGLDQEATRCREIADVIEGSKAGAREELLRIKSALQPPLPSQADLVRQYDMEQLATAMNRGSPFNVNTFEADEARRVEAQNEQLREKQRQLEEQRAAQVAADAEPIGPARR
jgi:hypothetical protein